MTSEDRVNCGKDASVKPLFGVPDGADRERFQVISLGLLICIVVIFTITGSGHPSPQLRVLFTVMESPMSVPQSVAIAGVGDGVGMVTGDGIGVVVTPPGDGGEVWCGPTIIGGRLGTIKIKKLQSSDTIAAMAPIPCQLVWPSHLKFKFLFRMLLFSFMSP